MSEELQSFSEGASDEISKVVEEVSDINPKLFKSVPKNQREVIAKAVISSYVKIHSGPLPAPEILRAYEEFIPNAGERLMKKFEQQAEHRIELEKLVIRKQMAQSGMGQIFAFIITLAFLLGGVYVSITVHPWAGVTLCGSSLIMLVAMFLNNKASQKLELTVNNPKSGK